MVRNLNDSPLERMNEAQQHARRENPLEQSSVRDGQVRFIRGRLLIDEGGTLRVVGTFDGNGNFEWSGPWRFDSGNGEIAGNVKLSGDFELSGKLVAGPVRIENGAIFVGEGTGQIVIDGATGRILAGDVQIERDKITVGGGASPATLEDGAMGFATGGKIEADTVSGGVRMIVGTNRVYVGTNAVAMQVGGIAVLVTPSGVFFNNLPTTPKSLTPDNNPIGSMYVEPSGQTFRVVPG